MRSWRLFALAVVLLFLAFTAYMLRGSLTPYVDFAEARRTGSVVQVRGIMASPPAPVAGDDRAIRFWLWDEKGEAAPVVYRGPTPEGLEHADSIVVVGRYGQAGFIAERLLVKCPSKYRSQKQ
ncbi:hypothetical protein TcarDRAFT_1071 [Thermosinus carboxydivorans Nor1]|uniref:Cytochrome c-type biogenesis protein CcmE n=1 Tax=Thermosinus carboxydivorans Nor1 TaxID=401526 RepID=A1HQT9_9FIRM|nr:cytochrome c maturation protein CcmE [Thermosinus carboxydivorans]EAX47649.1 hypothetical protein TcarDRAFT_1071 [Thermosinus carboxydivorans Nor1]